MMSLDARLVREELPADAAHRVELLEEVTFRTTGVGTSRSLRCTARHVTYSVVSG